MTLPDPLSSEFWSREARLLWDASSEIAMLTLLGGATGGIQLLPPPVQQLVDWNIFNQAALDYLDFYRLNTVRNISETTRKQAVKAIESWIQEMGDMPSLEARLLPIFGEGRASRIAVTEVTNLYATGNQLAWKASGVVGRNRWMTARDDRVCPICAPLHGMVVGLGENGFTTELMGLGITGPPAHVNCRCWLQPVVDDSMFEDLLNRMLGL